LNFQNLRDSVILIFAGESDRKNSVKAAAAKCKIAEDEIRKVAEGNEEEEIRKIAEAKNIN